MIYQEHRESRSSAVFGRGLLKASKRLADFFWPWLIRFLEPPPGRSAWFARTSALNRLMFHADGRI
jgi:hypothetical protein